MQTMWCGLKIDISLEPGIHVFYTDSAVGKTHLGRILASLRTEGFRTGYFSYEELCEGFSPSILLNSAEFDIVLLGRYDMYFGQFSEEIQEFARTGSVLLDCKQKPPFPDLKMCVITRNREAVEVRSYDYDFCCGG